MRFRPGRRAARAAVLAGATGAVLVGSAHAPASVHLGDRTTAITTAPSAAGPSEVPVDRAGLVCPGPEQRGMTDSAVPEIAQDVRVEAVSAPEEALPGIVTRPGATAGAVAVRRLAGAPVGEIGDRGSMARTSLDEADAVVVDAQGALAPGLGAAQLYHGDQEQRLALSLTGCPAPAEHSWLVAGGGAVGRSERIVLVNPGVSAVDVRVGVLGAASEAGADAGEPPGTVVALGPGEREILLVDALAPGVRAPVVEVTSSPGPVAAFLGDRWLDGNTDAGMQLTTPVGPPATTQVLGGLGSRPGDGSDVTVRAAVPGSRATVVQVRALTPEGPARVDAEAVVVQSRAAQDISVGGLPDEAVALEVTSERPVVAAAQTRSSESETGARDLAWSPGMAPLRALGGTPLPRPPGQGQVDYSLEVVAPRGGRAQVLLQDAGGDVEAQAVDLAAGRTWSRELDGAAVWVVPESGEVYATVTARSQVRPRPAPDDVEARRGGGRGARRVPVDLVSVLPVTDLAVTRPVLAVVPAVP
ncbi:MAG TPA: DUF5719 family protein [Ornithinimicrobium sp.]|uniref:DUF5719 family protein n=1 Tax=Ornithinimicrobium sp. TaxID=1977084 RepID=UPI002B499957|nr:DUF5719 family protein [Ornithinimicrobium sp.]HKJ12608.1 DUF5719 family protein [Ornithinimicrobium sp.]